MKISFLIKIIFALVFIFLAGSFAYIKLSNRIVRTPDLADNTNGEYSLCKQHEDCVIVSETPGCPDAVHKQFAKEAIAKYGALCPMYAEPLPMETQTGSAACMENVCRLVLPARKP